MKFCSLLALFLLVALALSVNATSEPACMYTTIKGVYKFFRSYPAPYGVEYIDYGNNKNNICVQRVSCPDRLTYETKIEKCSDLKVDCNNKGTGEFPACCVKC